MFYKVWSGTAKHLRSILFQQKRPVEIPGFAILAPLSQQPTSVITDLDSKPIKIRGGEFESLINGKDAIRSAPSIQVKLILHNNFIEQCGDQL
jgi:hypothetical protein